MEHLLSLQNLHVSYHTPRGIVQAVRGIDLTLDAGEVLAVVGESGCGKSALLKAIMRLLPENASVTGKILVNDTDIAPYPEKQLQKLRGSLFSMVFQDPMTARNPSMTIGSQIAEAVLVHEPKISKDALRARVLELMELVEIDRPMERMKLYPHNFSGGMRQRAVMAIALAARAKILLADEPTTALDVTIQAQILDLLRDLQKKLHTATILVSHDLGVVASSCSRILVMYGGQIMETGKVEDIFYKPHHPYTMGLLKSIPKAGGTNQRLESISGTPPDMLNPPKGCPFYPRCEFAMQICKESAPPEFELGENHCAKCWLCHPEAPKPEKYQRQKGGVRNG